MYTILMPVDESEERAVAQSETVLDLPAEADQVLVYLLHVSDTALQSNDVSIDDTPGGEIAYERLTDAGVAVETLLRGGDPAETIIESAEQVSADMILLGGRKRSPLGSLLFGSVSQAVTLDAKQPVTITGNAEQIDPPSHRCHNCGRKYYLEPAREIASCNKCGGAKVEALTQ